MKQVDYADCSMHFYVDDAKALFREAGAVWAEEESYDVHTPKKGRGLVTSLSMRVSDCFSMVKMVRVKMN